MSEREVLHELGVLSFASAEYGASLAPLDKELWIVADEGIVKRELPLAFSRLANVGPRVR